MKEGNSDMYCWIMKVSDNTSCIPYCQENSLLKNLTDSMSYCCWL